MNLLKQYLIGVVFACLPWGDLLGQFGLFLQSFGLVMLLHVIYRQIVKMEQLF